MSGIPYNASVKNLILKQTYEFFWWFEKLPKKAKNNILRRLNYASKGHFGDFKTFEGIFELRFKNGFRVYAFIKDDQLFIVLAGGNKNGQTWDIKKAKKIKEEIINGSRSHFTSDS